MLSHDAAISELPKATRAIPTMFQVAHTLSSGDCVVGQADPRPATEATNSPASGQPFGDLVVGARDNDFTFIVTNILDSGGKLPQVHRSGCLH